MVRRRLILVEFADFEVFRVVVDGESYQCGYAVESLSASGARVDVQQVVALVIHHAQYVRVPADEDVGAFGYNQRQDVFVVVPRVAADVGHNDFMPFALKELRLWQQVVHIGAIHIAEYGDDGFEFAELVEHVDAYVASVPEFVAFCEKGVNLLGDGAVCVRKDTDAHWV